MPVDPERLSQQRARVFQAIQDGMWYSLDEIADRTGDPRDSVSARLRDLRKARFGGYVVESRRRDGGGTWEYRLPGYHGTPGENDAPTRPPPDSLRKALAELRLFLEHTDPGPDLQRLLDWLEFVTRGGKETPSEPITLQSLIGGRRKK
jgi:biotin operon repressor